MVVKISQESTRNFILVLFIASTITLLTVYTPTTFNVWIESVVTLAVAGFAIWKIGTPSYFNYVDITRFRAHVFGNVGMMGLCCIMIILSAIILPFGLALASTLGYLGAISLGMMRISNVFTKRQRFNTWRF